MATNPQQRPQGLLSYTAQHQPQLSSSLRELARLMLTGRVREALEDIPQMLENTKKARVDYQEYLTKFQDQQRRG